MNVKSRIENTYCVNVSGTAASAWHDNEQCNDQEDSPPVSRYSWAGAGYSGYYCHPDWWLVTPSTSRSSPVAWSAAWMSGAPLPPYSIQRLPTAHCHTFNFWYKMWGKICAWWSYDTCSYWACPVYWPGLVGKLGYWLTDDNCVS